MGKRYSRCLVCCEEDLEEEVLLNTSSLVPDQDPLTRSICGRVQRAEIGRDFELKPVVLGTGYSGAVRLAQSLQTKQQVAVKQFCKRRLKAHRLQLLQSEVAVYLRLDHPNICRLLHAYETKHDVWLVMELCGSELYSKLCERKSFCERDAADLMLQMLQAVGYLHSHNIVHRDLKLENWLLGATGHEDRLKLIDFGFSRILEKRDETLEVPCGTLHYTSPEVLARKYTSKCDIWSLGVICYMLLIGRPPFHGSNNRKIANVIKHRDFPKDGRWASLSEAAQDFVSQLLQKDASQRPQAARALEHSWLTVFATTSTQQGDIGIDVLKSLRKFARGSHLRRAALTMLAYSLTSKDLEDLEDDFLAFDQSGRGTITLDQLTAVMREKLAISPEEVRRIFQCFDCVQDDELHYTPFVAAMLATRVKLDEDKVRTAFERFVAKDGGKFITSGSLARVFNGPPLRGKAAGNVEGGLLPHEAEQWIDEVDYNGNGVVDYKGFLAALMGRRLWPFMAFDETGAGAQPSVRVFRRFEDQAELPRSQSDILPCRNMHGELEQAIIEGSDMDNRAYRSFRVPGSTSSQVRARDVSCSVDDCYFR